MPNNDSLKYLSAQLDRFAADRDWNQFHTPKNLAMAVAGEVGELRSGGVTLRGEWGMCSRLRLGIRRRRPPLPAAGGPPLA